MISRKTHEEKVKVVGVLMNRIPRAEVEEIGRCVKEALDAVMPGCRYTLTGG